MISGDMCDPEMNAHYIDKWLMVKVLASATDEQVDRYHPNIINILKERRNAKEITKLVEEMDRNQKHTG